LRARSPERGRLERKRKLLARLMKKLDEAVVIVEGKRDARALREVGVKGRILLASGRMKGICGRVNDVDEVMILTDNDEAGRELAELLRDELESCGIRPDVQVRRDLRYVLGIRTVEEMPRKLMEFERKLKEAEVG